MAGRLQDSFRRLYESQPEGLMFTLSDSHTDLRPREGEISYAVGYDETRLLGYAKCTRNGEGLDIGAISMLGGMDAGALSDFDGQKVTRPSLGGYDGYSAYGGSGPVLHIGIIDIFAHGLGFGSILLGHIKRQGFELIELEANGIRQSRFFMKNGFIDTGIDSEGGQQVVMVWNNPIYSSAAHSPMTAGSASRRLSTAD